MLVSQTELIELAIANRVISFPTDTVPAVAAKPEAAALLYQLKQRPTTKPLILMGASLEDLLPYVKGTTSAIKEWKAIADKYFPGALTLVLPASDLVPSTVNPTEAKTIGIRVPNLALARDILSQTGVLATTSANLSGRSSLLVTSEIDRVFPQLAILEDSTPNEPKGSGMPSTVVQWLDSSSWRVLRQGSVNFEA